MKPTAVVIAYSKFIGVPKGLAPATMEPILDRQQDRGSDAGRLIECAGRCCYDSYGAGRSSADFHKHILDVSHGSVLHHASLSFYISGISRGCSHELVRHGIGTGISQRSTRYVDESESEWAWHPLLTDAIKGSSSQDVRARAELSDLQARAKTLYRSVVKFLEERAILSGTDKQTARKQARGAARGALGNALSTAMVWTANIRALRNVIEQRASRFADAEIRLLANALLDAALDYCPEYFSDYEKGSCPDGIGYEVQTLHRKV